MERAIFVKDAMTTGAFASASTFFMVKSAKKLSLGGYHTMYHWLRPVLFRMDAESAHNLTISTIAKLPSVGHLLSRQAQPHQSLRQELWGLSFAHPVGLAAGLDKNGEAVDGFLNLGFSFMEVGTVTPKPQPGNPKPRLFRLVEDDALINRMGFNNEGSEALARRLMHRRANRRSDTAHGLIGINIGKNKVTPNEDAAHDYVQLVQDLYPWANFFVINVSSPNTPGLRDLQAADSLVPLVEAVLQERDKQYQKASQSLKPPVLVKLAPDLADDTLTEIVRRLMQSCVDGFIATNTTIARPSLNNRLHNETGGLSGRPLKERSTAVLSLVYKACAGRLPIVASGGVFDADDAYAKILAGASLVELYTALIYKGPQVIREIVEGLEVRLKRDGFTSISEAVGKAHS